MADCTPQALATAASCFCDPRTSQLEVYLLALIAGVEPDPQALATAAAAYQGMDGLTALQAQVWLLCQIAGGVTPVENVILLEDGTNLLLENGTNFLIE